MNFYDDPKNVQDYISMCKDYDGSNLYQLLKKHVKPNASVLELGSGGGLDLEFLAAHYNVTGSDRSDEFLKVCKRKYPAIEFLNLDASAIQLDKKFDVIYSNKVLHHLTEDELVVSLSQQSAHLNENGVVAHSFWIGDENLEMHGMLFSYYSVNRLKKLLSAQYEIIDSYQYTEFEENDSLFVLAQIKK